MWEKSIVTVLQSKCNIYRDCKKKQKQIWKRAYEQSLLGSVEKPLLLSE